LAISGLVVTMDDAGVASVLAALRADPRITLGPPAGVRQPVVIETAGPAEDDAVWAWLRSIPGVRFVDVAYVHFDQGEEHDHG